MNHYVNYMDRVKAINDLIDKNDDERDHGNVLGLACDGCRVRRGRTDHKFMDWRKVNK